MSEVVTPELKQARANEFIRLLPLTLELAGLPKAAAGGLGGGAVQFTHEQMEARVQTIRTAYKLAVNLARDIASNGA